MESLKALMNRKIGGIPVLWIVAVVAAVALYGALRMKPSADVEGDPDATEDADGEGDLPDTSQPVFSATPVIMQPSGPSVSATPMEDTNELWGRRAIEYLVGNGVSLSVASAAVTKYLSGDALSMEEGKARDKAVAKYGLPPEGLLTAEVTGPSPSQVSAPPASKQGEPPTTHTVKSQRDNNPRELARVYYGLTNADAVNLIKSANTTMTVPYRVGQTVRIPKFHKPVYYRATTATRTLYKIANKNGTTPDKVASLNPGMRFPVAAGTRVRVK